MSSQAIGGWYLYVQNLTKGWVLQTYENRVANGDPTPQLTPADPVQLADGFKGTWSFADYPATPQPRQATFKVRALTAADLAVYDVDPGDVFRVELFNNGAGTPTWFRCNGYADEPEVTQDGRGLVMEVAVVDPLAALPEVPIDDPVAWPSENLGARLARLAGLAGINLFSQTKYATVATMGPMTVNNQGALGLLQEALAGCLWNGKQLVLRGGISQYDLPLDPLTDPTFPFTVLYEGAQPYTDLDAPVYWVDVVGKDSRFEAPYTLTIAHDLGAPGAAPGVGMYVAQRTPKADLHELDGGAALPAGQVIRDQTKWIKSRDAAINTVKLVGTDASGNERSVTASYPDLVAIYGPRTRTVKTSRYMGGPTPAADAAALLPDRSGATPGWAADQFTLTTKGMTADQMHDYADKFYAEATGDTGRLGMQLPFAVVDVDTDAALTGGDLSGVIVGAVFQLSKGTLTIQCDVRPELTRPVVGSGGVVTWADLRAEVAANDATIAWSSVKWHSDDAVPYQGSDRTFDADQAHPNFHHEQLSWRDLRLTGVD